MDRTRIKLGEGEPVFRSAKAALRRWEQFRLGWVEAWPPDTPIQAGEVVAVMGRAIGVWWLNACRIVYVVDESGPISKFGFAYGTLPGHVESGGRDARFRLTSADARQGAMVPTQALPSLPGSSVTRSVRSTGTSRSVCRTPEGHCTSSSSIRPAVPSPKCSRRLCVDA